MAQLGPKQDLSRKTYVLPCGGERKHGREHSVSLAVWDATKGVPISLTSFRVLDCELWDWGWVGWQEAGRALGGH